MLYNECGEDSGERGVAADQVVDSKWSEVVVESVAVGVSGDVVFVDESDGVIVLVD